MALNQEIWQNYIAEQLIRSDEFIQFSKDVSGEVVNGKIVHLANAGALPTVTRNRASWPVAVAQRTDTEVLYALDEYSTAATHIAEIEKIELNYDKIGSVMQSHVDKLRQTIGDWLLYYWLGKCTASTNASVAWSSGTFVATTGDAATASIGDAPSSGTLKKIKLADVAKAASIMDRADVPDADRILLLPACFHDQLLTELSATAVSNQSLMAGVDIQKNKIIELFGFKVMKRSKVALFNKTTSTAPICVVPYSDDGTITAETTSYGYGAIAYQKEMVERAIGEIKMFENLNDAIYQGDLYSASVRAGGRGVYSGGTGIVPIIQTA